MFRGLGFSGYGAGLSGRGHRVANRKHGQGRDHDGKHGCGGDRDLVAPDEAGGTVAYRVLPGGDRKPSLIAVDVLGEVGDRRVAPVRFFPERRQNDGVEITG